MLELGLRALFLLACASIGYQVAGARGGQNELHGMLIGLAVAVAIMLLEVVISKRPIASIGAIIFGLIAGSVLAFFFNQIARLIISDEMLDALMVRRADFEPLLALFFTVTFSFLGVMIIYKTRDRFRFIIPYVEFQKEEKGARPIIVDTSAVIDGRLADLCETGIFDSTLIVPRFVLQELQQVADSGDRLRRNRGRRGLELLQRLQRDESVTLHIHDGRSARGSTVDSKLVSLAGQMQARILTCDYNLAKLAAIQNVEAINLNDLTNALRPTVLPGEELSLKVLRPGDEPGQGVGYLADGTMVVVDQARDKVGQTITLVVTSSLQTSAGRMVFGRVRSDHGEDRGGKRRSEKDSSEREA